MVSNFPLFVVINGESGGLKSQGRRSVEGQLVGG
jgi:hypothetical protein